MCVCVGWLGEEWGGEGKRGVSSQGICDIDFFILFFPNYGLLPRKFYEYGKFRMFF